MSQPDRDLPEMPEGWYGYKSDSGEQGFLRELDLGGSEFIYWHEGGFRYRRTLDDDGVDIESHLSVRTVTDLFGRERIEPFLERKVKLDRASVRRGLRQVIEWLEGSDTDPIDAYELGDRISDWVQGYAGSAQNAVDIVKGPKECGLCGKKITHMERLFTCEDSHHSDAYGNVLEGDVLEHALAAAFRAACEHYGLHERRHRRRPEQLQGRRLPPRADPGTGVVGLRRQALAGDHDLLRQGAGRERAHRGQAARRDPLQLPAARADRRRKDPAGAVRSAQPRQAEWRHHQSRQSRHPRGLTSRHLLSYDPTVGELTEESYWRADGEVDCPLAQEIQNAGLVGAINQLVLHGSGYALATQVPEEDLVDGKAGRVCGIMLLKTDEFEFNDLELKRIRERLEDSGQLERLRKLLG